MHVCRTVNLLSIDHNYYLWTLFNNVIMANAKYERIWKLLDEYEFAYDSLLSDEFLCVICNSILKNPYQSPCGCRFCMECIVDYLNDKETHCPGSSEDCKDQLINFNGDLHADYVISRKISQVKVKCPKALCDYRSELQNIGNHISSHKESCPYTNIGCQYPSAHMGLIVEHLHDQIYEHGKLVTESFANLKNEVASLTLALKHSKQELENKDNLLIDLENRLNELQGTREIKIQELTETLDKCKEENVQLSSELRTLKSVSEVFSSNQKPKKGEKVQDEDLEKYKVISKNITQLIPMKPISTDHISYAPFEWKIRDFKALKASTVIPTYVISRPFYSHVNGYKLCMTIHPSGTGIGLGSYISVFIHVMKGEFDSNLAWPMKLDLRICLVDQISDSYFVDKKFDYSSAILRNKHKYSRPFCVKNIGIGESQFIQLNALFNNSRIYLEDSIILKCFVG